MLREAGAKAAPGAVIALTGISPAPVGAEIDLNVFNKNMVLSNKVLFGSVNAARSHYESRRRSSPGQTRPGWASDQPSGSCRALAGGAREATR